MLNVNKSQILNVFEAHYKNAHQMYFAECAFITLVRYILICKQQASIKASQIVPNEMQRTRTMAHIPHFYKRKENKSFYKESINLLTKQKIQLRQKFILMGSSSQEQILSRIFQLFFITTTAFRRNMHLNLCSQHSISINRWHESV